MKLQVIITKQTVSEGFYIMMRGHAPNPKFKSCISHRLDYKTAYWTALGIASALSLAGNEAKVVNDQWAEQDGRDFCELMAFENLETDKD